MTTSSWPSPDAPRADVDAFLGVVPPDPNAPKHEVPPMASGPNVMCSACEKVRISPFGGSFCKGCSANFG